MGWPEVDGNGQKIKKIPVTHGGRPHRFAGPIPARPAAVGRENLPAVAPGCPLPPWSARVAGGWLEVPPSVQSSTTRKWLNGSTCVPGLESFFPRVLGAQELFEGIGFHLASQVMFI